MAGRQNTQLKSKTNKQTNENGIRKNMIMIEIGQNVGPLVAPLLNLDQQFLREQMEAS